MTTRRSRLTLVMAPTAEFGNPTHHQVRATLEITVISNQAHLDDLFTRNPQRLSG
jgi:hypothetical protein